MTAVSDKVNGRAILLACWVGLALVGQVRAQISPEEHAKHHPDQAAGKSAPSGMKGAPGMGEMMGGMDGMMMGGMGRPSSKELYPAMMGMQGFSPERKQELMDEAANRMRSGMSLVSDGAARLGEAAEAEDYEAMRDALGRMREGLTQLESGVATRTAIEEGKSPQDVAMTWFKRELNLSSDAEAPGRRGPFGLSWSHFFAMTILIVFSAAMIGMYFFKMRRAARLLKDLTGGATLAPASGAATPAGVVPVVAQRSTESTPPAQKWSGKLRVGRIFQETPDVKTFRLVNALGGMLPFNYLPGQFLTVTVTADGKPVKRSYTIASSPTQHEYAEITVKHEEGGVVSGVLHGNVKEGDVLEFSGPSGAFIFTGRECKCILLVGGGVGITPLMSVIRYLTDRSWPGEIFLLYSIHNPLDFIFREELEYLQHRHLNLHVVVTVSHPEGTDWKGQTGRITKELIVQSVPDLTSRYVHLCGPVPMMEAIRKTLVELGVPQERIKTEAFGRALGKPEPTPPAAAAAEPKAAVTDLPTATFSVSNKSAALPSDKTILDIADEIGVEIDNSCRVGTCGTCRVKLLSGNVTMAVEDGLEPGDKDKGIILACQARSAGNVVVKA